MLLPLRRVVPTITLCCTLGLLSTGACHRPVPTAAATDCLDPAKANPQAMCTLDYQPVCGCDGNTYANACVAERTGVRTYTAGPCAAAKP